jgi:membrane-associated protease RseP (regulator of RpoE activity)
LSISESTQPGPMEIARQLAGAIEPVFATESMATLPGHAATLRLDGRLLTASQRAFGHISAQFGSLGYTALMRPRAGGVSIYAMPGVFAHKGTRDRAAILLFGLTVVSMLFASAAAQAPDLEWILRHPLSGLPFAASLLAILAAHEFGHYWMARRLGVDASLPYFIPMPFSLFGTMGAIMRARSPMRDRRQVLALGAAGPVAGLLVAVPVLIIGLLRSQVQAIPPIEGLFVEGNSLFYLALKFAVFGRVLPRNGMDVFLDPVAFAAWAGLLLTSVNLIPAGQLDGGHIAYALFGERTRWLNRAAVIATALMGLVWSGWFIWTALLFVFGQRSAEPLDTVTTLTTAQKALAWAMLVVFLLLFTPVPMYIQ